MNVRATRIGAGGLALFASALMISCAAVPEMPQPSPAPPIASTNQLDELLAPIALYPDPLIAAILPAATVPGDIQLAARYLDDRGDPALIDAEPWDPSVKALAHYPTVLRWMDENAAWTDAVAEAFINQQAEVMESIQRLRAQARAAGNLESTPQQNVYLDGDYISILPTEPTVMYIPRYDPEVIYVERPIGFFGPMIFFGEGFRAGVWLGFECDWRYRRIWVGDWHPGWGRRHERGRPWRWDRRRPIPRRAPGRWGREIPHPRLIPGTPPVRGKTGGTRPPNLGRPNRTDPKGWREGIIKDSPTVRPTPKETALPSSTPLPARTVEKAFGGVQRVDEVRESRDRGIESRRTPVGEVGRASPAPTKQEVSAPRPAPVQAGRPALAPTPRPAPAQPPPEKRAFGGVEKNSTVRENSTRGAQSRDKKQ